MKVRFEKHFFENEILHLNSQRKFETAKMEYTRGMKTIQVDYENKLETLKVKTNSHRKYSFQINFLSYNYPMKKLVQEFYNDMKWNIRKILIDYQKKQRNMKMRLHMDNIQWKQS